MKWASKSRVPQESLGMGAGVCVVCILIVTGAHHVPSSVVSYQYKSTYLSLIEMLRGEMNC